ncbi:MAG: hypothetical protein U9Q99_02410 [Nanoarchaeota archaeon]|nr:hypothetical protein [Nanoarchaeota archaeon]
MSDYVFNSKRNKGKNKLKEKKKHPYKSGGRFRSISINLSNKKKDKK